MRFDNSAAFRIPFTAYAGEDMDVIKIHGGRALRGDVVASGSKNAALPIMAASILADEPIVLDRVPDVTDVDTLALVLGHLGIETKRQTDGRVHLRTVDSRRSPPKPNWSTA